MKQFKIELPNANYYSRIWLELYDGGSDEWLYVARDGLTYVFIQIIDLPPYCGSDANVRWNGQVSIVNLSATSVELMASATQSCGCEDDPPNMATEQGRLAMAQMLFQYGAESPMWSSASEKELTFDKYGNCEQDDHGENDPEFRSLRKEAREHAEQLLKDSEFRDHELDTRIVNAIGQTAREFAGGIDSTWNALRRIKAMGDEATPEQKLVLKIYGACEQTLGAGPIPNDLRNTTEN